MKFLKNLVSFLIPLFIVLMTFSLYSSIVSVVNDYKKTINNDYAIMVVASTPLITEDIVTLGSIDVKNIQTIQRKEIIANMQNKLSTSSIKLLEQKLPFFYKIYLEDYPTVSQLFIVKKELSQISNITRIETFSSDHSKIYSLLLLIEKIVSIVFVFIILFAILILYKQISIWFFEHHKRIQIISYHGGSILYSAIPIIQTALISSVLASILTIALSFEIQNNLSLVLSPEILNIITSINSLSINYIQIIIMSFIISLISILGVLIKHKISSKY